MKKLIIIFVIIFFNTKVFSKEEIRTIFGFYVTVPSNFIPIRNQNLNELRKQYNPPTIDKDALNRALKGTNLNVEFFFPIDIEDPENHTINIVNVKGVDIRSINSSNLRDYCSLLKKEVDKISVKKNIQQYSCEFTNKFNPKFQPAIFIYREGLGSEKFQIQYQIQTYAGGTTFTATCNNARTCELMNGYVSQMIRSIR